MLKLNYKKFGNGRKLPKIGKSRQISRPNSSWSKNYFKLIIESKRKPDPAVVMEIPK